MREGPRDLQTEVDDGGITPAYAGRTSTVPCTTLGTRDHPRLCGKDKTI